MNIKKFKLQIIKNNSSLGDVESEFAFSNSKELLSYLNSSPRKPGHFYRISFDNSSLFIQDKAMTNETIVSIFEDCMGDENENEETSKDSKQL